ncbi:MAG: protein phosphatase 2C domain-containing protein [Gloeomargarita sp. SKYBB_i_bin120]|nr:protein phosphatase 2C domain-containing protein [Gloeomargarita sp. SKYG98]MCS7291449.1 protein phosphatase 2C domain-containing protein [Gloeomargarita sp. SKYB120]MDW8177009.1 protein phosphatase 2C domain-containing protein [Gloeomargarita sp. SKYBB_i_bin120]
MDNLECSNPSCYSLNPETQLFCQVCGAPLETVFLWVPGEPLQETDLERPYRERYRLRGEHILLDVQPGRPPLSVDTVPIEAQPYLRLFPWRLHLPQIYAVMPVGGQLRLLLSQVPLLTKEYSEPPPHPKPVQPFGVAWTNATAFRQLNWLWQIARLWPVLNYQQVASSLLKPQLLRVEGPVLRLRELAPDPEPVSLAQLGELLQRLVPTARSEVREPLAQWCEAMIQQQITSAEEWLQQIEQRLALWRETWNSQVTVIAQTDPGPTRRRNEDACYPKAHSPQALPLAIVCDGIGGHEGGDQAANLAVESVSQHLNPHLLAKLDTKLIAEELATVVCQANERIAQVNNQQQRQERQRMGTTLTLAFIRDYDVFVANVGDSRAYWITRSGCYQMTTDDDVASREVRLGYSLYPQALRQPAAGALVQALGISASSVLHPAVQRFLLDEDSVFLLCSDGLSDNNLVDQHWQWEILPILTGERDLVTAAQRLIQLANRRNGHDNVTVVLLHYQVLPAKTAASGPAAEPATQGQRRPPLPPPPPPAEPVTRGRPVRPLPRSLPPAPRRPSPLWLMGLLAGLLTLSAGVGLWWHEQRATRDDPLQVTASTLARFSSEPTVITAPGRVSALAIDPQGKQIAVGSDDGGIYLWQLPAGQRQRLLRSAGLPVMGLAFVRQGEQLVSSDRAGLELWRVPSGRPLEPLAAPKGVITAMASDGTGRFLAVGDANGTIYLWDLQLPTTGPTFRQDLPELGKIDALAVSPAGRLVAAGSQSQSVVEVWEVLPRQRRYRLTHPELRQGIWSLAFRGDGRVLAAGSGVDGRVLLWDMAQGNRLRTLRASGIVYDLLFSPDKALLFTATGTVGAPAITVWNPATGREVQTLTGHLEAVKLLAITPDGRLLISAGDDNQVRLWSAQD